ncbi:MAG: hypothetical protein JWR05_222 [Mucilaginibacter sp.]|nr:hypothetical protein [Mucilaginibacter sp.]
MLNMKVDNPYAFRFIMEDEIYLLDKDKGVRTIPSTENIPIDEPPAITKPILETPQISFNYLGDNNKRFLVLGNYATEEFIAAEHLTALENILKRKELAIADVAIFNINTYPDTDINQLTEYFKPEKLLVLGASALPAGINKLMLNEPAQSGSYTALYSFSFDEMMSSNDNKKAFWEQMKKL